MTFMAVLLLVSQTTTCHYDQQHRNHPERDELSHVLIRQHPLYRKETRRGGRRTEGINGRMQQDSYEKASPRVVKYSGDHNCGAYN